MSSRDDVLFGVAELPHIVTTLATIRRGGLAGVALPELNETSRAGEIEEWIERSAGAVRVAVRSEDLRHRNVDAFLRSARAVIVRIDDAPATFVAIVRVTRKRVAMLTRGSELRWLPLDEARAILTGRAEAPHAREIEAFLSSAGLKSGVVNRTRAVLLRERLAEITVARAWHFDFPIATGLVRRFLDAGIVSRVAGFSSLYSVQYLSSIAAWAIVGGWALSTKAEQSSLAAWILLVATGLVLQVATAWQQGMISIHIGTLLRQRLLEGAMKLDPDDLRAAGPSRHLGRVLAASTVERALSTGGFGGLIGLLELAFAIMVLGSGATGSWHVVAIAVWLVFIGLANWRFFRNAITTADAQIELTRDLVEKMVGYRTVAAQQLPERRHDGEDLRIAEYHRINRRVDRSLLWVEILMSHGWTTAAVSVLLVYLFTHGSVAVTPLAITIGGVLLVERALIKIQQAFGLAIEAGVMMRNVGPILRSASQSDSTGAVTALHSGGSGLELRNVHFRYRTEPVAVGWNLSIGKRDRVLVQGPSGGGKSTLCALMTGVRRPSAGTILMGGFDLSTTGQQAWHRRIACAPQFHENHVFAESFAFNLLMGRSWPPTRRDLQLAEEICRELGLGDLLDAMPGGMFQLVGDTGWQLSHGERSRLFIARALLQQSDLIVLDESFAALDPGNFDRAVDCVLRRAPALLVVAHP